MNEINSIDIDYVGTKLISAGKDAAIRLYDIETRKVTETLNTKTCLSKIFKS